MIETEVIRRRDLPHWDVPGATYFVTACLAGSIPARGLLDLDGYRAELRKRQRPAETSPEEWKRTLWKLGFARVDRWLDQEPAVSHLRVPELAEIVMNSLLHFAGQRYDLFAFVVMPSHFHWVFQPRPEWIAALTGSQTPRERIIQSVKGYTAKQCNVQRGAHGKFWQEESYDHWVRDMDELERIIHYIEANPVRAGLCSVPEDWLFSSARLRRERSLPVGAGLLACPVASGQTRRSAPTSGETAS